LYRQRAIEMLEGKSTPDHVHMCLIIPLKYSIAFTIGLLKGKSAVRIHRYMHRKRQISAKSFCSSRYCVSTLGLNEETIRIYIRQQEESEKQQLELDFE
jgi:putative transposase